MEKKKKKFQWDGVPTDVNISLNPKFKIGSLAVIVALLILEFGIQLYKAVKPQTRLDTVTAQIQTLTESFLTEAVVIREETVINTSAGGTVVPMAENASKVQAGETVARVFTDSVAASEAQQYASVKKSLAYYAYFTDLTSSSMLASMNVYQQEIIDSLVAFQRALAMGKYSQMPDLTEQLTKRIAKKQIAMGAQVDLTEKYNQTQTELNRLSNAFALGTAVASPQTGIYVNECDGYEQTLRVEDAKSVTPQQLNELLQAQKQSTGGVGKIVTQFNWYLVCNISAEQAQSFYVSEKVNISVDELAGQVITMEIVAMNRDEENKTVALVFRSNEISSELFSLRKTAVRIYGEKQTGFVIPLQAVRTVDGNVGVYVQSGNLVRFRKIVIGYTDENVILAVTGDGNQLSNYDEIIVKGVDLHDGAIIS